MSRYADSYKRENLKGPGDARPTGMQIIADEKREGDLADKVVIITGTSSGIGPATAQALAKTGATVYCTARDVSKAKDTLGTLLDSPKVHFIPMDLSSLASVKAFADEIKKRETKVNILINNAGVMRIPTRTTTQDGFETQMGTNHLASFYLFAQLRDLLLAGSTAEFDSRVVNVSSSGHRFAPVQLDDLNLEKSYDPQVAYGSSKTANIHMANHLERLYGGKGLHGYSLMPGGIVSPLQRYIQDEMKVVLGQESLSKWMRSPEQGCATTVFAAVARELEGKGAVYLENAAIAPALPKGMDYSGSNQLEAGYTDWAFDKEREERLWKVSLKTVGLAPDFDNV